MGEPPRPKPPSIDPPATLDPRMKSAWRAWLTSLATNAEAATAAAHLYAELPGDARAAGLDALDEDLQELEVPSVAIYGPLLTVETDPVRAARIRAGAAWSLTPISEVHRALLGTAPGGVRMAALVFPLYLDFVRLIVCRFVKDRGFDWVRQDPILHDDHAPVSGSVIEGVQLFACTTEAVVDELAHAVLAQRREDRELPKLLRDCADLFSAKLA